MSQPKFSKFKMGSLDHVHIRVPCRDEAVKWYQENLGLEIVERFRFWAEGFEGGPVQMSADGGRTMLAIFEASESHPMQAQTTGIAFTVDLDTFLLFARSLPRGLASATGEQLQANDIVDFDMCWAYDFSDPWGNRFELNCYDYQGVKSHLISGDGVEATRYWPRELYDAYTKST